MITLALVWGFLLFIGGTLGGFALHYLGPKNLDSGARFFLAHWLGLFLWSNLLLWITPFHPLSPHLLAFPALIGFGLIRHHPLWRRLPPRADLLWSLPLIVGLLAYGVKLPTTSDAVSYQYDIHAWLSRIGTVPGLAQFHPRFGFFSSWFTLPALFNHGFLEGRMTASVGSFAACLATLQALWAARRAVRGTLPFAHLAGTAALTLAMIPVIALNLAATPSHDVPIVILSTLCFWTLLLSPRNGNLLPVFFAGLALATKLSSLPLLAFCGLYGLAQARHPVRYAFRAGLWVAVLIVPWMINQVILTGWPLFPLGFPLDLPWTLDHATQEEMVQSVRGYAPWSQAENHTFLRGIANWIRRDSSRALAAGYLVLGLAGGVALLCARRGRKQISSAPLLLGVTGVAFWAWTTAHPRFGWGVLAILPATWCWTRDWNRPLFPRVSPRIQAGLAVLTVLVLLVLPPFLWTTRTQRLVWKAIERGDLPPPANRLWLPPRIPAVEFDDSPPLALPHTSRIRQNDELPLSRRPMCYPPRPSP